GILRLKKTLKSFEREPMLIESPRIEVLLARREIFLDAFREWRPSHGVRLDLRHKRRPQRLRSLQVGELRALPRDNIAGRRATMNPDWAIAIHPKTALAAGDAALVDGATLEVPLVQNEAFYGLRHLFSVRVLVHGVKSALQAIDS
ncbi:MAG TPA: hypothetical protein VKV17_15615, partial [Bryobacteraceae bacterium]|nr:hypothetical protein [Bryobacteraceae bacterium]